MADEMITLFIVVGMIPRGVPIYGSAARKAVTPGKMTRTKDLSRRGNPNVWVSL
jgi:hypothetical protein